MNSKSNNSARASRNTRRRIRKSEKAKLLRDLGITTTNIQGGSPLGRSARDARWNLSWEGAKIPTPFGEVRPGSLKVNTGRSVKSGMVGLAERTDDIQVIMPRLRTESGGPFGTMDVVGGTEFLLSVNNPGSGSNPGDILTTLLINPSLFSETRLAQFAKLYQRYRFRKLEFWYKPTANATQSGQLIGFADYDPDNLITVNSSANLSIAAAHLGQSTNKIWETAAYPFGIVDDYTSLFVDSESNELRLAIQGVYYLLAASDIASTVTSLGNIYIDYIIEFYIPLLHPVGVGQLPSIQLQAGSGVMNKPLGLAPAVVDVLNGYPDTTLSFTIVGEDADIFYNSSTGVLDFSKAFVDGDTWIFVSGIDYGNTGDISSFTGVNIADESVFTGGVFNSSPVGALDQSLSVTGTGVTLTDDSNVVYSTSTFFVNDQANATYKPLWTVSPSDLTSDFEVNKYWLWIFQVKSGQQTLTRMAKQTSSRIPRNLSLSYQRSKGFQHLRVRQLKSEEKIPIREPFDEKFVPSSHEFNELVADCPETRATCGCCHSGNSRKREPLQSHSQGNPTRN